MCHLQCRRDFISTHTDFDTSLHPPPPPLNPPFIRLLLICINLLSISGSHHDKQRKGNVFLEILGSAAGVGGKTKVSIKQTILSCTPADSLDLKSDM